MLPAGALRWRRRTRRGRLRRRLGRVHPLLNGAGAGASRRNRRGRFPTERAGALPDGAAPGRSAPEGAPQIPRRINVSAHRARRRQQPPVDAALANSDDSSTSFPPNARPPHEPTPDARNPTPTNPRCPTIPEHHVPIPIPPGSSPRLAPPTAVLQSRQSCARTTPNRRRQHRKCRPAIFFDPPPENRAPDDEPPAPTLPAGRTTGNTRRRHLRPTRSRPTR